MTKLDEVKELEEAVKEVMRQNEEVDNKVTSGTISVKDEQDYHKLQQQVTSLQDDLWRTEAYYEDSLRDIKQLKHALGHTEAALANWGDSGIDELRLKCEELQGQLKELIKQRDGWVGINKEVTSGK